MAGRVQGSPKHELKMIMHNLHPIVCSARFLEQLAEFVMRDVWCAVVLLTASVLGGSWDREARKKEGDRFGIWERDFVSVGYRFMIGTTAA